MKALYLLMCIGLVVPAAADSLWPGGRANFGNHASLVTDTRALQIGDLVTVRIMESASAEQDREDPATLYNELAEFMEFPPGYSIVRAVIVDADPPRYKLIAKRPVSSV